MPFLKGKIFGAGIIAAVAALAFWFFVLRGPSSGPLPPQAPSPQASTSTLQAESVDLTGIETEKTNFAKYYSLTSLNIPLSISQYNLPLNLGQISNYNDFSKKISLSEKQINDLKELAGDENILTDDFSRANFSYGKYYSDLLFLRKGIIPTPPDVVIAPKSHNDVIKLLTYCNHNKIPIIPVGGQSSVTRGVETPQGGIALDLTKHLNQVLDVNEINMTANVQAGMFGPAFEEHLNKLGYSCGHFPQSFEYSTVGGWVAARGAGQASTGYGKIDDMIVALKVVTPAGVIENKDYPANAEAWDTYPLFVGSEGTLGVITEVTMKIRNLRPENTKYASFVFKSFEAATSAMRSIMQSDFGTPHLFRISDPEETDIAFKTKGFEEKFSNKVLKALGYLPGKRCLMFVSVEGDASYTKFVKKKIKKTAKKNTGFYIGSGPTKNWLEQRYSSAYMRDNWDEENKERTYNLPEWYYAAYNLSIKNNWIRCHRF